MCSGRGARNPPRTQARSAHVPPAVLLTPNECSSNLSERMSSQPRFDIADFPGDITLDHVIPAAAANFGPLPADLRPELLAALGRRGIERLYSHQAEAYDAVRRGMPLVARTPTASGKTLCHKPSGLPRFPANTQKNALFA